MAKRRDAAVAEAHRRARAQARPARSWATQLEAVRDDIDRLDRQREGLLALRDGLVAEGRRQGASWAVLEGLAGVSRPALLKRVGGDG